MPNKAHVQQCIYAESVARISINAYCQSLQTLVLLSFVLFTVFLCPWSHIDSCQQEKLHEKTFRMSYLQSLFRAGIVVVVLSIQSPLLPSLRVYWKIERSREEGHGRDRQVAIYQHSTDPNIFIVMAIVLFNNNAFLSVDSYLSHNPSLAQLRCFRRTPIALKSIQLTTVLFVTLFHSFSPTSFILVSGTSRLCVLQWKPKMRRLLGLSVKRYLGLIGSLQGYRAVVNDSGKG